MQGTFRRSPEHSFNRALPPIQNQVLPDPKQKPDTPDQPDGANDPLPHSVDGFPVGEGSYEGTRGYQARIENYLETADVELDAKDAAPQSRAEAKELLAAEDDAAERSRAPGL
jgi:hypothetical protein